MATPTMVRNTASGPTVFSGPGAPPVEWMGAGDPMGRDIQPVPAEFLDNVQFHQMAAKGVFEIVDAADAVKQAMDAHKQDWEQRLSRQRQASQDVIDQAPQNDSLVKPCIGPSGKGPEIRCGVDVPVKASQEREKPPLCTMHEGLAAQFVSREGERIVEGKPEIVWMRVTQTATARQDH